MASIYSRNGILWIAYKTPLGKRVLKSLKLKDDREGWSQAKLYKTQLESAIITDPVGIIKTSTTVDLTISVLLQRFRSEEGRNKAANTLKFYDSAARKVISYLGDANIRLLTKKDMFDLRDKMLPVEGDQNTAIYLRHFKALLNWAVNGLEVILRNPLKGVDFKPKDRPVIIFKDDEIDKILAACSPKLRDQCTFLLMTGFRLQESCDIEWGDIDLDNKVIHHDNQKGKRVSPYPIRDILFTFLANLPRTYTPKVFGYSRKGSVDHEFLKVLRKIGIVPKKGEPRGNADYSIHTLKRTYVSRLIKQKELSYSEVHYLSHHKDMATTNKYYSWFDTDFIRGKQNVADVNLEKLKKKIAAQEAKSTTKLRLVK